MHKIIHVLITSVLVLAGTLSGNAQTKVMNHSTNATELATLGGGCFWCTEAIFQMLEGVKSVASGYAGGTKDNPTYEEVCTGKTGHAEVIQVEFDPKAVSYEKILETFWEAHDPTTLNRKATTVELNIAPSSCTTARPNALLLKNQKPRPRNISSVPSSPRLSP